MKKLAVSICLSLLPFIVSAQSPCLPDGITFATQEQIDSFQVNYPGCTEIEGGVVISGEDIKNLNGLNILTFLDDYLLIYETGLTNFEGLSSLISIEDGFYTGLFAAGVDFINPELTSFTGLTNLTSIGGSLAIGSHPTFTSFSGLENLTSIGESFEIWNNDALTSISELDNLTFIGETLAITSNDNLINISGLNNIDIESLDNISIIENSSLSTCDIQSICEYLATSSGTIDIYDNAPGCNSPEEVEEACENQGIGENSSLLSLTIQPNPTDNGSITITLDNPNNLHLTCFNTYGQQVYQQDVQSGETVINVSTWQPGIYLAVVYEDGKAVGRAKFVVQ